MNKNKQIVKSLSMLFLALMIGLLCNMNISNCQSSNSTSSLGNAEIPFEGNAKGGELVIGYIPDPHSVHITKVSTTTSAGEIADSVVNNLARAIINSDAIITNKNKDPNKIEKSIDYIAQKNTLRIPGMMTSDFIISGTETGMGIPEPPYSLSASYNKKQNTIDVKWINPLGDNKYDSICIRWSYRNFPGDIIEDIHGKSIWDTPTSFTIKLPKEIQDFSTDIWIKGYRHTIPINKMREEGIPLNKNVIPSDAAAIHITSNGYSIEELDGIPFFRGVAPNWLAWSTATKINFSAFEQGDKYEGVRRYQPTISLSTKPYYQIIKAPGNGIVHGVYRKFIGLTPGHTYRLTSCLSTLEMDSIKTNWSYSLHFSTNHPDGKNLTTEQMAGIASLPNGEKGPSAGQICYFDPNNTTKGKFDYAITSYSKRHDGSISSNITLPNNVNEITVWVKFTCEDINGKVGFSGVKLEDITAIKNPKNPNDIINEEKDNEIELLNWINKNQNISSKFQEKSYIPTKLLVEKSTYNFGNIKSNSLNKAVFRFTNTDDKPLFIKDVPKCCGIVANLDKKELGPGENGVLTLEYHTGEDSGTFEKAVSLITNESNTLPILLSITGTIIQTLEWKPKSFKIVSFEKDFNCPEIKLKSLDNSKFSVQNFASSSNCLSVKLDPNYSAPEITLKPKLIAEKLKELNTNHGSVLIELNHPNYKQISLNFDVIRSLQATPAQVLVFNADVNEPITKSIVLQDNEKLNESNISKQIKSITSENGTKIEMISSSIVDKNCKLDLKITPVAKKGSESLLKDQIVIKLKDGRTLNVPISIFYATRTLTSKAG